jgi:hypothetical protein
MTYNYYCQRLGRHSIVVVRKEPEINLSITTHHPIARDKCNQLDFNKCMSVGDSGNPVMQSKINIVVTVRQAE